MIGDIGYRSYSLWYETQVVRRALFSSWTPEHKRLIRQTFAARCIIKMLFNFSEDLYRYTRIFLTTVGCCVGQIFGAKKFVRRWKYWTNQEIINLAAHSLETSVYQVGWAHPRAGLLVNVAFRLAVEMLHGPNYRQYILQGFPDIEEGRALPIDITAIGAVVRARVLRIYNYAKLVLTSSVSGLKAVCGFRQKKGHWRGVVRDLGALVQYKLDVPRCELLMCSPTLGQRTLWTTMRLAQFVFGSLQS